MANIVFNNLKAKKSNNKSSTYVDYKLDFEEETATFNDNYMEYPGKGRDIKVATDISAIKNSLVNLFNTSVGERPLLPEYGSDLRKYIGEPISENNGRMIGDAITDAIRLWEPRISKVVVNVDCYIDRQYYDITLTITLPNLKDSTKIKGIFNRDGYTVFPT